MSWDTYLAAHATAVKRMEQGFEPGRVIVFSVDRFVNETRVPVGGFADRLKGICYSYLIALATDRAFFIDWRRPTPLANTYLKPTIQWEASDAMIAARPQGVKCDWIDYGFSDELAAAIEAGRLEEDYFLNHDLVTMWANQFRPRHLANSPYAARLRDLGFNLDDNAQLLSQVFQRLFAFHPTGPASAKFAEFLAFCGRHPRVLGVQFRTGGEGGWSDPVMDNHSSASLMAAAAIKKAGQTPGTTGFFVTTDSVQARDDIVGALQAHGEVFTFNVAPTHVDNSPDAEAATLADFVSAEFHALAMCHDVVNGNGGFGLIACWVSGKLPTHYRSLIEQA